MQLSPQDVESLKDKNSEWENFTYEEGKEFTGAFETNDMDQS
jgi:hypothetical protein